MEQEFPFYKEPLYRPPSEADSLIFQVSYGCPHNKCTFCPMYKGVAYKVRTHEDLYKEFEKTAQLYPYTKRIFLADGDVMHLPFEKLKEIFQSLNQLFPNLARISLYANGSSILAKSYEELQQLKKLKLFTLYMGLESGDNNILNKVNKRENADSMVKAVNIAQEVGIRMSVMVLLGLGGKEHSSEHITKSIEAVNKMNPKFLAVLQFIEHPKWEKFKDFKPITDYEAKKELYWFVRGLELKNTVFRANHASNPLPIAARFPKDKEKLIESLKSLL